MAIENKKLQLRKIISALIAEYEQATKAQVQSITILRGKNLINKQKEQVAVDVEITTTYSQGGKNRKG